HGSPGCASLQERQELLHHSRAGKNCSEESQSPDGSKSSDRCDHQDCRQARGEISSRQSSQRRNFGHEVTGSRIVCLEAEDSDPPPFHFWSREPPPPSPTNQLRPSWEQLFRVIGHCKTNSNRLVRSRWP